MIGLSVITPTYNRPQLLRRCCEQFMEQEFKGFTAEHIVVSDGPSEDDVKVCSDFPHVRYYHLTRKSDCVGAGDAGRDLGIRLARGRYVCFWNDDNVYYPHALQSLWDAAQGHDIGVVQVEQHKHGDGYAIPHADRMVNGVEFRYGDVDAACVCVQRSLASVASWCETQDTASDIRWLDVLELLRPSKRFLPIVIGEHR